MSVYGKRAGGFCGLISAALSVCAAVSAGASEAPWKDLNLTPDQRAASLVEAMTLDEKLQMVHSSLPMMMRSRPVDAVTGAGYVPGIPRLGVPSIRETDASLGVANLLNFRKGDVATALPSGLAMAATFDPQAVYAGGAMIGSEARAKRFNVMLAGGVNLVRDPRCGRAFEYLGEDPLLAGVLAGEAVRGIQSNAIVSTVKHFALNGQETARFLADSRLDEAPARESDLLAFEIAIERGHPGAVMSAYNQVNGLYSSENEWLLNGVLKQDWGFPGWVMSDWGNVHSTAGAAMAGLDQESGEQMDKEVYFGSSLKAAVESGQVPRARIDDMARRILRSLIAVGAYDRPAEEATDIDYAPHAEIAQRLAEEGLVLLKNDGAMLPLASSIKSIAVIGAHADVGVLSGGGSSQVRPVGGPALEVRRQGGFSRAMYDPSSPLKALQARWPGARVEYTDGSDIPAAVALARNAQVVLVFAEQWRSEGQDLSSLSLPEDQDALIDAIAAANPNTIVALETGGAVLMPWLGKVRAVFEAWYPGQRGAEALAEVLSGEVDPSGRLPVTFPDNEALLPRPVLDGLSLGPSSGIDPGLAIRNASKGWEPFDVDYNIEGANVGYKWFEANGWNTLFPFGYGLSYTKFRYSDFKVDGGSTVEASVDVRNIGSRAGVAVPQFYALVAVRNQPAVRRLIGWQRVELRPGETRTVIIKADRRLLGEFDPVAPGWRIHAGDIRVSVGEYAGDIQSETTVSLDAAVLKP